MMVIQLDNIEDAIIWEMEIDQGHGMTCPEISDKIGRLKGSVSASMVTLRELGLVKRTDRLKDGAHIHELVRPIGPMIVQIPDGADITRDRIKRRIWEVRDEL